MQKNKYKKRLHPAIRNHGSQKTYNDIFKGLREREKNFHPEFSTQWKKISKIEAK